MSRQIPPAIADAVVALVGRYVPDLTGQRVIEVLMDHPDEIQARRPPVAFTKREVCEAARLSLPTVNRMLRSGALQYRKIGRCVRIPAHALEQLLDGGEAQQPGVPAIVGEGEPAGAAR